MKLADYKNGVNKNRQSIDQCIDRMFAWIQKITGNKNWIETTLDRLTLDWVVCSAWIVQERPGGSARHSDDFFMTGGVQPPQLPVLFDPPGGLKIVMIGGVQKSTGWVQPPQPPRQFKHCLSRDTRNSKMAAKISFFSNSFQTVHPMT